MCVLPNGSSVHGEDNEVLIKSLLEDILASMDHRVALYIHRGSAFGEFLFEITCSPGTNKQFMIAVARCVCAALPLCQPHVMPVDAPWRCGFLIDLEGALFHKDWEHLTSLAPRLKVQKQMSNYYRHFA